MKKFRILSIILCLTLALQGVIFVNAEEVPGETTQTEAPYQNIGADAAVLNGCSGIHAQLPLCGSSKLLKTAGAAILYEVNSDTLMYTWNADHAMYPASLVKIMTALIAIEEGSLTDTVTVTQSAISALPANSSTLDLKPGETLTLEQLLYCLLVGSSNDAAVVIAEHIAGSQQAFLDKMNRRAQDLGCTGTNFVNPHGLHDDTQVTTARDMVMILREAVKSEAFMTFFSETVYTLPATSASEARSMRTTNYMMSKDETELYYDARVTGGRTGVTNDRERVLAVTAESGSLCYIGIVLGAVPTFADDGYTALRFGSYEEMGDLLELGFDGFSVTQVLSAEQILQQYHVTNGENAVVAGPSLSVSTVLPAGLTMADLSYRYESNIPALTAPVVQGQHITSLQVWYGGICVAQSPIVAKNSSALYIPPQPTEDDSQSGGLTAALTVVLCLVGGAAVIAAAVYFVRAGRSAAVRSQHRRRQRNRRRSR